MYTRPATQIFQAASAALALAAVCAASGWALNQPSKLMLVMPLAAVVAALLLVFAELRLTALWLWAPLAVLAYPLAGQNVNVTFGRVWIVGMLALVLILPAVRTTSRASSRLLWGLGALAVVLGIRTVLTTGTTADLGYGMRVWIDSILLPLILFVVVRRAVTVREGAAERIALALMIAGLLLALMGIGERMFGFQLGSSLRGASLFFDQGIGQVRVSGPYESPAPYGLALVLCLAATIYWLLMRRRAPETYLAVLPIVSLDVLAIFFNFFRVGWITAVVVIVAALGLRPRRFGRVAATVAVAAAVIGLGFTQLQSVPGVSDRINNTQNLFARLGAYEQGIEIFKQRPIFGVGANRYHDVASRLPFVRVSGVESVPDAHSSFIQTLAEYGIVGFTVLLLAFLAIWRLVREFRRRSLLHADAVLGGALTGAALAYLLYSLTLGMLPYGPSNQFFAAMLGLAAGRLDRLVASGRPAGDPQ
jgi:hypothetical protein